MDSRNVGKSSKQYLDTFLHKCTVINFKPKPSPTFQVRKQKTLAQEKIFFY